MDIETLRKDMIAAMKAHDKETKEAISSLVSAVKKLAIDEGCREDIPSEMVDKAILKEQRMAKEQLDACPKDREELRKSYQFRYDVISKYAPNLMSLDEVVAFLKENCADVVATKNMGQIMKTFMPLLKGKADGKTINQAVAKINQ